MFSRRISCKNALPFIRDVIKRLSCGAYVKVKVQQVVRGQTERATTGFLARNCVLFGTVRDIIYALWRQQRGEEMCAIT